MKHGQKNPGRRFTTITKNQLWAFQQTGLITTLNRNNITQLIVVGAYSELCIRDTATDALTNGLNVTLLFSAITTAPGSVIPKLVSCSETDIAMVEKESFFSLVDSLITQWNGSNFQLSAPHQEILTLTIDKKVTTWIKSQSMKNNQSLPARNHLSLFSPQAYPQALWKNMVIHNKVPDQIINIFY